MLIDVEGPSTLWAAPFLEQMVLGCVSKPAKSAWEHASKLASSVSPWLLLQVSALISLSGGL